LFLKRKGTSTEPGTRLGVKKGGQNQGGEANGEEKT